MNYISLEEQKELRTLYIEIGKMIQNYGNGQYNTFLTKIMNQIKCIDSSELENEKTEYLLESFKALFGNKYGLAEFIICVENKEKRIELNETYQGLLNQVADIFKGKI